MEYLNFYLNGKKTIKWKKKIEINGQTNLELLVKKKGSRSDFVNLYKEMKKDKDSKDKITKTENETKSWKDLIDTGEE